MSEIDITREAVERIAAIVGGESVQVSMLRALRDALDKAERDRDEAQGKISVSGYVPLEEFDKAERERDEALEALRPLACDCREPCAPPAFDDELGQRTDQAECIARRILAKHPK